MRYRLVGRGLLIAALFTLTAACSNGSASCEESCDVDSDCASGLLCFNTRNGNKCLPTECNNCFDDGSGTCRYEENTAEQDEGEMRQCFFMECT